MTTARIANKRNRSGLTYDRWFDDPWGSYASAIESKAIRRAFPPKDGLTVLDAGCGTGRFSTALAGRAVTVIGIDANLDMLGVAKTRLQGRCVCALVEALPFHDDTFDVTMSTTVLEFVSDPAKAMAQLARVTRPGGRVVIGTLNPRSPWGLVNRQRLHSGSWCDARFLSHNELLRLATPHGSVRISTVLLAPRAFPGLNFVGPWLEKVAHLAPKHGAFRVLTIDMPG